MPLGKLQKATYVSIKDGRLVTKTESGEEQGFDYLEGRLIDVSSKTKEFSGSIVNQYLFEFHDDEGERFIVSTGEKSGVSRALLNSLASITGPVGNLRLVPYQKDGFSKVLLYHNGERLDWKFKDLPPVNGNDDTERLNFFREIFQNLKAQLAQVNAVNTINSVNI